MSTTTKSRRTIMNFTNSIFSFPATRITSSAMRAIRWSRAICCSFPPDIIHSPVFRDFEANYERCVVWITNGMMNSLFRMDPDLNRFSIKNKENIYLFRSGEEGLRRYLPLFDTICRAYNERGLCHRSEGISAILSLLTDYNRALESQNERLRPASRERHADRSLTIYQQQSCKRSFSGNGCRDILHQQVSSVPPVQAKHAHLILSVCHPDASAAWQESHSCRRACRTGVGAVRFFRPRRILPRVPQGLRRVPKQIC